MRQKLADKLREIYDDKDFVFCTIAIAKTERAWTTILDFIETSEKLEENISSDNIQILALRLRDEADRRDGLSASNIKVAML